jgi:hypothetical protein
MSAALDRNPGWSRAAFYERIAKAAAEHDSRVVWKLPTLRVIEVPEANRFTFRTPIPAETIYTYPIGPFDPRELFRRLAEPATPTYEGYVRAGTNKEKADAIVADVCRQFGVTKNDLKSDRRSAPLVLARHVAMYLVKTETTWSLPQIGKFFGGRDHTTVLHAVRRITKMHQEGRL